MTHKTLSQLARHTDLPSFTRSVETAESDKAAGLAAAVVALRGMAEHVLHEALDIAVLHAGDKTAQGYRQDRRFLDARCDTVATGQALGRDFAAWEADAEALTGTGRRGLARIARPPIECHHLGALGDRAGILLDATIGSGLMADLTRADGRLFSPAQARKAVIELRLAARDGETIMALSALADLRAALKPVREALPLAVAKLSGEVTHLDWQQRREQLDVLTVAALKEGADARQLVQDIADAHVVLARVSPRAGIDSPRAALLAMPRRRHRPQP